ncbi:uncharacterized protein CTRU02_214929 [Colletotrichum truncatum]|uniref:Uncharacterized protein n=1 Tax=Colletotrichum truncatum TaxID=5467 RepID=A0ACC3YE44_COLTU|nr:uncharacterized protein CTRU02_08319 [Colletotrichum truncatum]KAF6790190.1 hypothetical protein CTRU02_08319 [Colletotrichum truncatum]
MSPIESSTTTDSQGCGAESVIFAASTYSTRCSSVSGATEKKRKQDDSNQNIYCHDPRTKLQKLQEKVKVHQKFTQESVETQKDSTTNLPLGAASTLGNSNLQSSPTTQNDAVLGTSFFMTPPESFDTDCLSSGARMPHQDDILNSFQSPATFTNATPIPSWDALEDLYCTQHPTPSASCSPSDILSGLDIGGSVNSKQSVQGLDHYVANRRPQLSPETKGIARENCQQNTSTADSPYNRVRHVMEQAAVVGFKSLDEVTTAYYTGAFEDRPSLCHEQRLSRNRRLPRLLYNIYEAAKGWGDWERRGFQEQMILGAEELLVQELDTFVSRQKPGPNRNSTCHGMEKDLVRNTEDGSTMARSQNVQNDLPNLWALITALLSRAGPPRQENTPETVLGIIETLCYGSESQAERTQ